MPAPTALFVDVGFALTWHSKQHITTWAMYMSIGCIVLGKLLWEVEVRLKLLVSN